MTGDSSGKVAVLFESYHLQRKHDTAISEIGSIVKKAMTRMNAVLISLYDAGCCLMDLTKAHYSVAHEIVILLCGTMRLHIPRSI